MPRLPWFPEFDDREYRHPRQSRPRPMAYSLSDALPYIHYSDEYWNSAQLIYGAECKTEYVNYSDRLWELDYSAAERAEQACKAAEIHFNTPAWHERFLSEYHGKPVQLKYMQGGTNRATGYTYYVYGYDLEEIVR